MAIPTITDAKREAILKLADKYGISNVRVFGSVARGDADENSDLDLLIDMEKPSLFKLGGFNYCVEELMGCRVDTVKPEAIKHSVLRERIFGEARPI